MRLLDTRRDRAGFLILVLGSAILVALAPFLSGLLGASVLYVVCVAPYRYLARVTNSAIASVLVLAGTVVVIALPLAWFVTLVVGEAPDAVRAAQNSPVFAWLSALHVAGYDVGAELARTSGTLVSWFSAQAFGLVGSAAQATLNLVIAFFGLYYMLHAGPQTWRAFRDYIPFSEKTAEALRERFYGVTRATLLGTALVAAAQGTIIGAAFFFVGLPNALFWGTVTAVASILPVIGSGLVWIPAVLVLVVEHQYGRAVALLLVSWLVASNVDNVIRPMVYRRAANIHPMITLVGAFAGVKYFGLPGLLLGPLAIAYFFELLKFYRQEYGAPREEEGAAPSTEAPAAPA